MFSGEPFKKKGSNTIGYGHNKKRSLNLSYTQNDELSSNNATLLWKNLNGSSIPQTGIGMGSGS
jgi:hypothetical protein